MVIHKIKKDYIVLICFIFLFLFIIKAYVSPTTQCKIQNII